MIALTLLSRNARFVYPSTMFPGDPPRLGDAQKFEATHWSVVLRAGQLNSAESEAALATLCETYWPPLYAFVRRLGRSPEDASDLVQEFFARLLEKNYIAAADPTRGKFRTFLLTAFKRFMANEWDKTNRLKRGGGQVHISLDSRDFEDRGLAEPSHNETAEKAFDRRWALKLLDVVLSRLEEEFVEAGKATQYQSLKIFLMPESGEARQAQVAADLGTTESAVKSSVHRMRQRYRELLREEIGNTVSTMSDIDDELRDLFAALT